MEWDLSELFVSSEDFYDNVEKVKLLLLDIEKYKKIDIEDSFILLNMLNDKWQIKELSYKLLVYGSLRYYQNIKSEECINMKKVGESLNNLVDSSLKFIDCKIIELGQDKVDNFIKENTNLKIYEFALNNMLIYGSKIKSINLINFIYFTVFIYSIFQIIFKIPNIF